MCHLPGDDQTVAEMAIFDFFDLLFVCLDHPRRVFDCPYYCAKFGWNRCSCDDNMLILILCELGLKMPIRSFKTGFFERVAFLNGEQY